MNTRSKAVMHLLNEQIIIRNKDDSAQLVIHKNGDLEIKAGTPKDIVIIIFDYFFFSEYGKDIRKSGNNNITSTTLLHHTLLLEYKNYGVTQLKGTQPEWWNEFQVELKKYINLLPFW